MPVSSLLGGTYGDSVELYKPADFDSPDVMASKLRQYKKEGFKKFQLKLGGSTFVLYIQLVQFSLVTKTFTTVFITLCNHFIPKRSNILKIWSV